MVYRRGTYVPLMPELDKHGLTALPVAAFFDEQQAIRFNDGWATALKGARMVLGFVDARGFVLPQAARERVLAERDEHVLDRWVPLAATARSADAFVASLG